MPKFFERGSTAFSLGGQTRAVEFANSVPSSATTVERKPAVMLQGTFVKSNDGSTRLMVSANPNAVDRKLAIRAINADLEGRSWATKTTKR